jgi:hypothetical protein
LEIEHHRGGGHRWWTGGGGGLVVVVEGVEESHGAARVRVKAALLSRRWKYHGTMIEQRPMHAAGVPKQGARWRRRCLHKAAAG